jgi:hypothetical protein
VHSCCSSHASLCDKDCVPFFLKFLLSSLLLEVYAQYGAVANELILLIVKV